MIFRIVQRQETIIRKLYCTQSSNKNKLYTNTIFLPKTDFPLRLDNKKLVERDEQITSTAEFEELYTWQRQNLVGSEFVLHDGPPYANGKLHMGHALNKILKDTILRTHILKGNKVHYVPGWDCHGLPIELKALSKRDATPLEIRSKARNFAKSTISNHMKNFKSWGVIGDWSHHYATYDSSYVKNQLHIFNQLYEKKLIYRDFKPIYWSPSSRTALAEAELEYNEEHKSPSVFVRFKIKNIPNVNCNSSIYALIWTTTPWTLPANQAVCYNPTLQYSLVKNSVDNSVYIVAADLIETLSSTLNANFEVVNMINSSVLEKCTYFHPVYNEKELSFLRGTHVTASKGTGLVHTAPAHGPDDFLVALNTKTPITNLVDETGCYTEEAGGDLQGKFVLDEGTQIVLQKIEKNVVLRQEFVHSYPYDWRTKKPVIIRASLQWFFDTESVKSRAVELLERVEIIPKVSSEMYKRTLVRQIERRPYWCISRQRKWGVPIPVLFNKSKGDVLLNEQFIKHYCKLVDKFGTDFWWQLNTEQLIPDEMRSGLEIDQIEKGEDILDIWFDSGISWANALEGNKVADMYLEGVDQFNGWFQSSLLTSVALRNKAPYKSIYVHGFVVDEKGMKMSKSIGNVVDPLDVVQGAKHKKPFGVDTLRWWVACHANQDALAHISNNVLQASAEELQKIRSVLRFALGSLSDYQQSSVNYSNLSLLDKYILHLLHTFHEDVEKASANYQFQQVCKSVINLLTNSVSALYYTGIKDRLYCDSLDDISRKCSQFVLLQIFEIVTQAIAPIVPHLVEEMFSYLPQKNNKTYFTSTHSKPEPHWNNPSVEKLLTVFLDIRKEINKEGSRASNAVVKLTLDPDLQKLIKEMNTAGDIQSELEDIFQVSQVIIDNGSKNNMETFPCKKCLCLRCRRVQAESETDLCIRCKQVMKAIENKIVATN